MKWLLLTPVSHFLHSGMSKPIGPLGLHHPVSSSITCMGSLLSTIGLSTTFEKCWTSAIRQFSVTFHSYPVLHLSPKTETALKNRITPWTPSMCQGGIPPMSLSQSYLWLMLPSFLHFIYLFNLSSCYSKGTQSSCRLGSAFRIRLGNATHRLCTNSSRSHHPNNTRLYEKIHF